MKKVIPLVSVTAILLSMALVFSSCKSSTAKSSKSNKLNQISGEVYVSCTDENLESKVYTYSFKSGDLKQFKIKGYNKIYAVCPISGGYFAVAENEKSAKLEMIYNLNDNFKTLEIPYQSEFGGKTVSRCDVLFNKICIYKNKPLIAIDYVSAESDIGKCFYSVSFDSGKFEKLPIKNNSDYEYFVIENRIIVPSAEEYSKKNDSGKFIFSVGSAYVYDENFNLVKIDRFSFPIKYDDSKALGFSNDEFDKTRFSACYYDFEAGKFTQNAEKIKFDNDMFKDEYVKCASVIGEKYILHALQADVNNNLILKNITNGKTIKLPLNFPNKNYAITSLQYANI